MDSHDFRKNVNFLETYYPGINILKEELLALAYPGDERMGAKEFRSKLAGLNGLQILLLFELLQEYRRNPELKIKVPFIEEVIDNRESLDYPPDFIDFAKSTKFPNKLLRFIKEVLPKTGAKYLSGNLQQQEILIVKNILICLEMFARDLPFLEFVVDKKLSPEEVLLEQFIQLLSHYLSNKFVLRDGQIVDITFSNQVHITRTNIDYILGLHYLPLGLRSVMSYVEDGNYKVTIPPHNDWAIFHKSVLSRILLEALREAFPNATYLFAENLEKVDFTEA